MLLTNANCFYQNRLAGWFQQAGLSMGKVMEFGSLEGLLTCIKEDLGITVMAKSLFDDLEIENEVSWQGLPEAWTALRCS